MLHVADVARSIRLYELLGFETIDTQGDAAGLAWARMHCEGGALMFLLAEGAVDTSAQSVLFAMYTPDLPGLRQHLLANGVNVPPISYPEYMPSGADHHPRPRRLHHQHPPLERRRARRLAEAPRAEESIRMILSPGDRRGARACAPIQDNHSSATQHTSFSRI